MTSGWTAENAELVLQAHAVHVANVEEVGGPQIGRQVLLLNLETNHFRVLVATLDVIHRHTEALALWMRDCDGRKQVGRERGDAFPWPTKSNLVWTLETSFMSLLQPFRPER